MKLKVQKITPENFFEYGRLLDPVVIIGAADKSGKTTMFFPETLQANFTSSSIVSLSILWVKKRPLLFDCVEAHDFNEEVIGGFNQDTVFHVLPKGTEADFTKARAFIVPKNNWIRFYKNVWHHEPFVAVEEEAFGYVLLPPYAGKTDVRLAKTNEPIEIIL